MYKLWLASALGVLSVMIMAKWCVGCVLGGESIMLRFLDLILEMKRSRNKHAARLSTTDKLYRANHDNKNDAAASSLQPKKTTINYFGSHARSFVPRRWTKLFQVAHSVTALRRLFQYSVFLSVAAAAAAVVCYTATAAAERYYSKKALALHS